MGIAILENPSFLPTHSLLKLLGEDPQSPGAWGYIHMPSLAVALKLLRLPG
jgi:hypothetical protein